MFGHKTGTYPGMMNHAKSNGRFKIDLHYIEDLIYNVWKYEKNAEIFIL